MPTPVVLVTGCSSGIGLATAVAAAQAGWTTVATLRDTAKDGALRAAAEAAGVTLDVRALDVTDTGTVAAVVDAVAADHGRLDVLVNNAGRGYVGTAEQIPLADLRDIMEVNFFGVAAATQAALPHLRAAGGRVITVTSVGGIVGQPFNEAYCAAKFAVEGYMESLAPVAATTGVSVSVVEPGPVATEFVTNVGVDVESLFANAGEYLEAMQGYLTYVMGHFSDGSAQSGDDVAAVILEAMTADEPAFRYLTSAWAEEFTSRKLADRDGAAVQGLTRSWLG
jgi:NAD(P)-dependent dehydrogenase (short-subunit alcohol dehydrogenase family)